MNKEELQKLVYFASPISVCLQDCWVAFPLHSFLAYVRISTSGPWVEALLVNVQFKPGVAYIFFFLCVYSTKDGCCSYPPELVVHNRFYLPSAVVGMSFRSCRNPSLFLVIWMAGNLCGETCGNLKSNYLFFQELNLEIFNTDQTASLPLLDLCDYLF